jgi:hypothetical protein
MTNQNNSLFTRQFSSLGYATIQELERISGGLPIIEETKARHFFSEVRRITGTGSQEILRSSGRVFSNLLGFISQTCNISYLVGCPDDSTNGILILESDKDNIRTTYCVARISQEKFLTYGWLGAEHSRSILSLRK